MNKNSIDRNMTKDDWLFELVQDLQNYADENGLDEISKEVQHAGRIVASESIMQKLLQMTRSPITENIDQK